MWHEDLQAITPVWRTMDLGHVRGLIGARSLFCVLLRLKTRVGQLAPLSSLLSGTV
jgi:hypothetical protein